MSIMDEARETALEVEGAAGKVTVETVQQALLGGMSPRDAIGEAMGREFNVWPQSAAGYELPVVIMAGGEGSRLRPLTYQIPKPLIPIGETTLVEMCMDTFANAGCKKFFVSLNYKADQIERYLSEHNSRGHEYVFYREDKPLGSGGSLSLIRDQIKSTFIVASCDIVLKQDFRRVIDYHRASGNQVTVVVALKRYKLTYGNMLVDKNQRLMSMEEKPEYAFRVNTAVYVFEPELLREVPEEYYPITSLIDKVIKRGARVGCFPITYGSWRDVGTWEDYHFMMDGGLK